MLPAAEIASTRSESSILRHHPHKSYPLNVPSRFLPQASHVRGFTLFAFLFCFFVTDHNVSECAIRHHGLQPLVSTRAGQTPVPPVNHMQKGTMRFFGIVREEEAYSVLLAQDPIVFVSPSLGKNREDREDWTK